MSSKNKNRIRKIDIRLTEMEYLLLEGEFQSAPFSTKSQFIRAKLFSKNISKQHQNRHQAFLAAAKMNTEINKIGNNFNQLVHGINTYKTVQLLSLIHI